MSERQFPVGSDTARVDLLVVADMVASNTRVLDIGCGDGTLLRLLAEDRGVDARGIELSQRGVNDCVAKGLSVIQGDADTDLIDYPDDSFDYVILSQTLQATRNPKRVLEQMLRIGRRAIVSFPNFSPGMRRPTFTSARSGISSLWSMKSMQRSIARWRWTVQGRPCA
jgi:methionine biosynthesis protein MetW